MAKKVKRDPNIPVLTFKTGETRHEILIAGRGELIDVKYKPNGGKWSDCSIIDRSYDKWGFRETEMHLHDPGFWGWIGRLITDGTIDRTAFELLTQSDNEVVRATA